MPIAPGGCFTGSCAPREGAKPPKTTGSAPAAFTVDIKVSDWPEVRALLKEAIERHASDQAMLRVVAEWYDAPEGTPFTPEMRARIEELTQE